MATRNRAPDILLVLLLSLGAAGCGRGVGDVTGTVFYLDRPLSSGTVMLLASDGRPYDAAIQSDGTYTLKNVPVGPARVTVTSVGPPRPGKAVRPSLTTRSPTTGGSGDSLIPLRYGDFSRSGLQVTVHKGANPFDIRLEKK